MEIVNKNEISDKVKVDDNKSDKDDVIKKELICLYIDEKKSILEISRIYKCRWATIKKRLKKYGISIRPHGAFAVDDDGETLNSKRNKGKISGGEYNNIIVKNMGYENAVDYQNDLVKNKGYIDRNEYNKKMYYERGAHLPMSKNKDCSQYLGIYICENKEFLSKMINVIKSMKSNNPGYDIVCVRDKKIDVKCGCLVNNVVWTFRIDKNKIADYFLMIAFDDRENLNVMHIWLVKGNSVIEKTTWNSEEFIVNEKDVASIGKGNISLKRWKKYEITNVYKLKEAQKLCNEFKNKDI